MEEKYMFISHRNEIPGKKLSGEALKDVTKQVLIGPDQGWDDYVMRMLTIEKDGFSPRHAHDWPHVLYVVEGEGTLHMDGVDHPVEAGSTAFVSPGIEHQLMYRGGDKFVFICIVPKEGDK